MAATFSVMISETRARPVSEEAGISTRHTPPRVEEAVIRQTTRLSYASASIASPCTTNAGRPTAW